MTEKLQASLRVPYLEQCNQMAVESTSESERREADSLRFVAEWALQSRKFVIPTNPDEAIVSSPIDPEMEVHIERIRFYRRINLEKDEKGYRFIVERRERGDVIGRDIFRIGQGNFIETESAGLPTAFIEYPPGMTREFKLITVGALIVEGLTTGPEPADLHDEESRAERSKQMHADWGYTGWEDAGNQRHQSR